MRKIGKKGIGLLLFILALVGITGCGNDKYAGFYDKENKIESISSQTVASNAKYELKWDDMAKCILLESKETGEVWSDIVYEEYLDGSTSARANSPISITYAETTELTWDTAYSFDSSGEVRIACEQIKNGICVTYYYDRFEIAVPVKYELRDNSLAVSIDGAKIQESMEKYCLVAVNLTPYLASCKNSEDNYLFVPSGSGALIYANETADGTKRYSAEMYGTDAGRMVLSKYVEEEPLRLPVFGAKDTDSAMMGIIEKGAGAVVLDGQAGNKKIGASNIGANFYFRGYDTYRQKSYATGNLVATRMSEERSEQEVTVVYYPLQGEKADYNGMAEIYREYLIENGWLKKEDVNASAYSLTLLGGTTEKKSFLGVPYDSLVAMTDFKQAQEIVSELTENVGTAPVVRMLSYGDNGLAPGTIIGGSKYPNVFGSKKQLSTLQSYCEENGIPLFWDMDAVQFSKAGMGISYNSDVAKTAILKRAEQYALTPLRVFDEENPYRIVARDSLSEVMEKAVKKAEKYDHQGLSFSSLGSLAYGDYDDVKYIVKSGIESDVTELLAKVADERTVATAKANWYAACASNYVFDVPTEHGDYDVLDEQIPFYQMIFHGYRPLYSEAINLSENASYQMMLSASSGMGMGYVLTAEYVSESDELNTVPLYGTLYEDNRELIKTGLDKYQFAEYYESTKDSIITRYEILKNGVSATHYENGTVLYANHTAQKVSSPAGELEPYGFVAKGK